MGTELRSVLFLSHLLATYSSSNKKSHVAILKLYCWFETQKRPRHKNDLLDP